jgi:hypothetical protein
VSRTELESEVPFVITECCYCINDAHLYGLWSHTLVRVSAVAGRGVLRWAMGDLGDIVRALSLFWVSVSETNGKLENDARHTTAAVCDVDEGALFFFAQEGLLDAVVAGGLAAGGSVAFLGTGGLPEGAKRVEGEITLGFACLLRGFRCTGVFGGMDESKCGLCGSDPLKCGVTPNSVYSQGLHKVLFNKSEIQALKYILMIARRTYSTDSAGDRIDSVAGMD